MKVAKSLFLCLGILLCASCAQQDEELGTSLNRSSLEKVTVTAGPILPPPTTRVTAERDGQVMHFNWEKDDAILLANTKQQLPYLATQAGASTQFLSALTGSDNVADYINGVVDKGEIYAYYPYNAGERIDMATKCVAISQDEPFLYAVDTIKNEAINLHFYHAFAYLKLNVSMVGEEMQDKLRLGIAPDYHPMTLIGPSFNFATNQVEYTDYKDEMELTADQLADTEHLYPILPTGGGGYFRLSCQVGDTINGDTLTQVYKIDVPQSGLKAGRVYEINLQFNAFYDKLAQFYKATNGDQWKNNTNWLSGKPLSEWYGITTDEKGHITEIDLSDNNLVGDDVSFEFPRTLTSFKIDNNAINSLYLTGNETASVRLDNCVTGILFLDKFNKVEVVNCDALDNIFLNNCTWLMVSNCNFNNDIDGSGRGGLEATGLLEEVIIENCTMSACSLAANTLTIENSTITPLYVTVLNQLNITSSTLQGVERVCFNDDTQINLHSATLIGQEYLSGVVLSNITKSLTGTELNAWLDSYQSDIHLLQNIYLSTNVESWTNHTNWLTDKPWNEWYGIKTNSEGHITSVELPNNNLTGKVYAGLVESSYLTHLNLDKNNLSGLEISNWTPSRFTSYSLNESNMDELNIFSVDSVYVSDCTIPYVYINYRYTDQTDNGICSFSNCTINSSFMVSCKNMEIHGGSYENYSVYVSKQLTIKNATIGFEEWTQFGVDSYTDVILENVTIKYLGSTHDPVTLTKTFKGSEWQAIFNEAFGIQ